MADRCETQRREVGAIEADIDSLQDDLQGASTQQKAGIAGAIAAARRRLTTARGRLRQCEMSPPPPLPPPPPPRPPTSGPAPLPPPPTDKCAPIRRDVRELEADLRSLQDDLTTASTQQKAGIAAAIIARRRQLAVRRAALAACVGVPPPPPRVDPASLPLSITLRSVRCIRQEDSELPLVDNEDDEPYVLVMAINTEGRFVGVPPVGITLPASLVTRIGPLDSVDRGETRTAPANTLWDLEKKPAPIAHIDRIFLLVSVLEHDSAKVTDVENRVVTAAQAGLPGLLLNAEGRSDLEPDARLEFFIETARQSFDGAISLARLHPLDPDDQIGPAQVLRFTDAEQQSLLRRDRTAVQRRIRFSGDGAVYELMFELHP